MWNDRGVSVISAVPYSCSPPDFVTWAAGFSVSLWEAIRSLGPEGFDVIHAHVDQLAQQPGPETRVGQPSAGGDQLCRRRPASTDCIRPCKGIFRRSNGGFATKRGGLSVAVCT